MNWKVLFCALGMQTDNNQYAPRQNFVSRNSDNLLENPMLLYALLFVTATCNVSMLIAFT
jgi:hypothetical protein